MKKRFLSLFALCLICLLCVTSNAWGETTTTYIFTSKAWADKTNSWTSDKDGFQYSSPNVQVTTAYSGAGATSNSSISYVKKIRIYASTTSKGVGNITVKVGDGTAQQICSISKNSTATWYTLDYATPVSGKVTFVVNCTTNSMYVQKIEITCASASTVTFNAGTNGTCATSSLTEASAEAGVTLPSCTPNDGYTFDGWSTTENGSVDAGVAGTTYKPLADCTLYAVYSKNTYTLSVSSIDNGTVTATPNGGSAIAEGAQENVEYNKTITLSAIPDVGFAFSAWDVFKTEDASKKVEVVDNSFVMPAYPVTVSAIVEASSTEYAVTIANPTDATITVKNAGSPIASGATFLPGTTLTLEKTINGQYTFNGWKVTNTSTEEDVTSTVVVENTLTVPSYAITISCDLTAYYVITWMSKNAQFGEPVQVNVGSALTLPNPAPTCLGYEFVGWTATQDYAHVTDAPTYVTAETVPEGNATYYAVFAVATPGTATLTKAGSSTTFAAGNNIVVVASGTTDDNLWSYMMYQETVSTSYVNYKPFVNNATTLAADSKNSFTLSAVNDGKWILGDATNGYVNNKSSNDLTVDTESSSSWTISWNSTESKFSIKNGTRWLACRSDLTGDNQYKFRGGGTSSSPIEKSTAYFDIYLLGVTPTTYSNYTTNPVEKVATPTFTISAGSYTEVQSVSLVCSTDGATIRYTTNGNDVTEESTVYSEAISVNQTMTIKAMAFKDGMEVSDQASATYQINIFNSLQDLIAADITSGTTVKVTFANVPIKNFFVSSKTNKTNGIYFDIQKGGNDIEIYYSAEEVPTSWVAGGTVSGTMTCPWTEYNGTWELAPDYNTWSWNNLTYLAPYTREVNTANLGTICVPYAFAKPETMTLYNIVGKDDSNIYFEEEEAEVTVAGKPYLFRSTEANLVLPYVGAAAAVQAANGLVGTFELTDIPNNGNCYVLKSNKLYIVNEDNFQCGANRAYINVDGITGGAPAVKTFALDFSDPTNIRVLEGEELNEGVRYNLAGQVVGSDYKGVVIMNGKKYINK